jgi:hypothetical protein
VHALWEKEKRPHPARSCKTWPLDQATDPLPTTGICAATAIATTAVVIAPTTAAGPTTAATTSTFGARAGFIHTQGAALQDFAIQPSDGVLRLSASGHFHKCKTAWFTAKTILDNRRSCYLSKCRESFTQIGLSCIWG